LRVSSRTCLRTGRCLTTVAGDAAGRPRAMARTGSQRTLAAPTVSSPSQSSPSADRSESDTLSVDDVRALLALQRENLVASLPVGSRSTLPYRDIMTSRTDESQSFWGRLLTFGSAVGCTALFVGTIFIAPHFQRTSDPEAQKLALEKWARGDLNNTDLAKSQVPPAATPVPR
jgi:hypothetical protein